MTDTDSDTEIRFNMRKDTSEGGQGDNIGTEHEQHAEENPIDNHTEADDDQLHYGTPEPEVPRPRDIRRRSRSYENLDDHESQNFVNDRRRDQSTPNADYHNRYRQPKPYGRNSPSQMHSPVRFEEPVFRPATMGPHRLHVKPEIYDGVDDWDQYISHFQNCADLGRWSETDKALALAACLKGQARAFYLGLNPVDRSSYCRLVQKFSERFGSVRQQTRYLTKFETRRRNLGETIASLGDDLRLLVQRSYPELGPDAQESLALHQFYKAISLEMKCRCIDRDCRTIESAVQIVERYEAIFGEGIDKKRANIRAIDYPNPRSSNPRPQSQHNRYNNNRQNATERPHTYTQQNTTQLLQQVLDRLEKLEGGTAVKARGPYRQNYRRGACFICQSTEHYMNDCPTYLKLQSDAQNANNGNVSENSQPSV